MWTNRNVFWPTIKKCIGVALLTGNWFLVKTAYKFLMADRQLIETAIRHYNLKPTEVLMNQSFR